MKKNLLYEKYRPKSLEDMVLPKRIRDEFANGLNTNVILHGHFGTGKSTLAKILIGKYTKATPYLELNTSLHTSIEVLRTKIYDFCVSSYVDFDSNVDYTDATKYVFLDEFDGASNQYQDALKGFIEEMSRIYNVRFIFVTNHINKVHDGIKSRMTLIDFDSKNMEEIKDIKTQMYKRIKNEICVNENITITKDEIVNIINKCFPDFRKTISTIQNYANNRLNDEVGTNAELSKQTIELVLDKNATYKQIYDFVFSQYGDTNIHNLLTYLGRDLVYYIMNSEYNQEILFDVNDIVVEMNDKLNNSHDPLILGVATIGRIRKLYI